MFLSQVSLTQFRNYEEARFSFGSGINLLYGSNGAGKTNLLDAIHYLSVTRSYFNALDQQQIMLGARYFAIDGLLHRENAETSIRVVFQRGIGKSLVVNNNEQEKFSSHIGAMPVVMIAPGDIALIQEGSEFRRKFTDMILSQHNPVYLHNLQQYNRALDQRNKLLRDFQLNHHFNRELIEVYNEQLSKAGSAIFEVRTRFMEEFLPLFLLNYKRLGGQLEAASIQYSSDLHKTQYPQLLQENESADLELQRTSRGIHRDDFVFTLMDQPLKKFGSQGQQKSYILALKLAHFQYLQEKKNVKPILLLDDIFEKLDQNRLRSLFSWIMKGEFGQVFITDTQMERTAFMLQNAEVPVNYFEITQPNTAVSAS